MQVNRTATVLFAEPSNETKRSEASRKALAQLVVSIAESTGGRVVKTIGGKLMVVFASPDAAASAASKIQAKIDAQPPVGGVKIGVHIGFHSGPAVTGGTVGSVGTGATVVGGPPGPGPGPGPPPPPRPGPPLPPPPPSPPAHTSQPYSQARKSHQD